VHHMQAHVLANLIPVERPSFPFLCLTVSGGHTQIVCCDSPVSMRVLGETIDDAAGEAFDKTAKLLGLPCFSFPEPRVEGLDFSFSGLKTSILYFLRNAGKSLLYKEEFRASHDESVSFIQENLNDICASVQSSIIRILLNKLEKAVHQTGVRQICLAGGVSANRGLRRAFQEFGERRGLQTFIPDFEYCTDNAAMIAITGYYKFLSKEFIPLHASPSARSGW